MHPSAWKRNCANFACITILQKSPYYFALILASGLDSPSIVFYLGIMAFGGFEYHALRRRRKRGAWTHLMLISAGVFAAALIYVVL
jgi:hypothetical protein